MELMQPELQKIIETDWIFRTILGRVPPSHGALSPSTGCVSVFVGDPDSLLVARSLMFQAALSVCDTGGNAVYFTPTRWVSLPVKMCEIPYPDLSSLRRLKMVYRTNPRDTVRALLEDIKKTSGTMLLFVCIEDLTAMCRAVARKTDWSVVKSMASVLCSLEEVVLSARLTGGSLRIVGWMDKSMELQCKEVFQRFGVQTSHLTATTDTVRAQLFGPTGKDTPVHEISLSVTPEGLKYEKLPRVDVKDTSGDNGIDS
ncbi:hypothetical protein RvY_09198 [Ramazzottius varieornatus]|uniref:Uncharacterized protein n=1 Tax=Ramazzottius varieornatus TaxID=947166 RepID=A0A1D1VAS1_RAMVA|nr:hypothetical protein RvY_09198 [Ramazzottius varieornatus]